MKNRREQEKKKGRLAFCLPAFWPRPRVTSTCVIVEYHWHVDSTLNVQHRKVRPLYSGPNESSVSHSFLKNSFNTTRFVSVGDRINGVPLCYKYLLMLTFPSLVIFWLGIFEVKSNFMIVNSSVRARLGYSHKWCGSKAIPWLVSLLTSSFVSFDPWKTTNSCMVTPKTSQSKPYFLDGK